MTPEEFKIHLYSKIWQYKVDLEMFNSYMDTYIRADEPTVEPDDYFSSRIPELIHDLGKNYPLEQNYQKVVYELDEKDRLLIHDFMSWYGLNKNIAFIDIYAKENYGEGFDYRPLNNLMDHIKTYPGGVNDNHRYRIEQSLETVLKTLVGFNTYIKPLTHRRKNKPVIKMTDEYDMQDCLLAMLKPYFHDIKSEQVVDTILDRHFLKIDFLIPNHKIALECKYYKHRNTKPLLNQLAEDLLTYGSHSDCRSLVFFIYDKNSEINDPHQLEKQFRKNHSFGNHSMEVYLIVSPK